VTVAAGHRRTLPLTRTPHIPRTPRTPRTPAERPRTVPTAPASERALLIGIDHDTPDATWTVGDSLAELAQLAATAGAEVLGAMYQRLREPVSATYLGKGKLVEVRDRLAALDADTVIADDELSPAQQRHLEEALDARVLDRTALILDIFARHARTHEGALQVELAQLEYRLPRLAGRGEGYSRLGAGIGTRGPGETKLESDRRRIRGRIAELRRALEEVRRQRSVQRRWRGRQGVPVVAIVGYTNAGKSTLLNRLTEAGALAEDKLFATLDPTTRTLALPHRQQALITDTVGFIQKLPTDLVAAFKATLEEVGEADLLLHVVDVSSPHALAQALTVYGILAQLGAEDKRVVTALNKSELVDEDTVADYLDDFPNPVAVSAARGLNLEALRERIAGVLAADFRPVEVVLPYEAKDLLDLFHLRGAIDDEDYRPDGAHIRGRVPPDVTGAFRAYRVES
jgi:GTP-binding protein HflX